MSFDGAARAIWRYKWLVIGLTLLTVVTALFLEGRQDATYETSTLVRIQQVVAEGELPATNLDVQQVETYSQLLTGSAVTEVAAERLAETVPGVTATEVALTISGSPIEQTDLLVIEGSGSDPERVAAIVNGIPGALRAFSEAGPGNERIAVVDSAGVPVESTGPPLRFTVALALIMGLIVSSAIAVMFDLVRDRFASPKEVEQVTGVPVLASVPTYPHSRSGSTRAAASGADEVEPERPGQKSTSGMGPT